MKNKRIILILFFMTVLIIVTIFYYRKYCYSTIDFDIINKKWYEYDPLTGYYDVLYFENNRIIYKTNNDNEFNDCSKYTYDKKNKILNLDCDNKIEIKEIKDSSLKVRINEEEKLFFTKIDDALNNKFERYYKKNLSEYKKEYSRIKEILNINYNSLLEVLSLDDNSMIFVIGSNCSSIECSLVLETMEKNMSNNNIYYFNIDNISDNELKYLNNITNNKININRDYYNGIYPKVLITNNYNIIDEYDFICNGLDCSKYLKIS